MTKPKFKVGDKAVYENEELIKYVILTSVVYDKELECFAYRSNHKRFTSELCLRHPTQEEIDLYYNK